MRTGTLSAQTRASARDSVSVGGLVHPPRGVRRSALRGKDVSRIEAPRIEAPRIDEARIDEPGIEARRIAVGRIEAGRIGANRIGRLPGDGRLHWRLPCDPRPRRHGGGSTRA